MKLNFSYYKENTKKLSQQEKDIIKYLKEKDTYEEIIKKDNRLEVILSLSNIKSNIINWYPIKKNSKILELNANYGEITQTLCENENCQVIAIEEVKEKAEAISQRLKNKENLEIFVGRFKEVEFKEKFNYILAIGINEKFEDVLKYAYKYLEEDGILLYSVDNEIGIKKINEIKDITKNEENKYRISKNKIVEILNKNKITHHKFYYPLPDYKKTNIIFTDNYLPSEESILRDLTLHDEETVISFDERDFYKNIIRENKELFKECASSYLVEISNKKIENQIKYVSFGNSRKEQYRLKTIMLEDEVCKQAVNEKSNKHIEQIKKNIDILERLNFNVLDKYDTNNIFSKLVKENVSFDKKLIEIFEQNGIENTIEEIKKFNEELKSKLTTADEEKKDVFEKYNITVTKEVKEKMHFIKDGIFDLIFQNCFLIDNKFYFYDQEWIEENIPIEFIMYRAIFYLGNSKKEIDTKYIYEKIGIQEYLEYFEQLEERLQEIVKDEIIWKIHANNNKTIKNLYDTQIHLRNLEAQKLIQKEQELESVKKENNEEIQSKNHQINLLQEELNYMKNSKSWKITKPLRGFRKKLNK